MTEQVLSETLCTLSVDKGSIRVFASIAQFLGKVGSYIFIEVREHDCTFRSLNDSSQCFGSCKFDRAFFRNYEAPHATIRCKLPIRCFIAAFKNLRSVHCIELSFGKGTVESVLIFKLMASMGVVKQYRFCIEECEILEAVFDTNTCLNKIVCNPQKLSRIFGHMHGSVEVAMQLATDHVRVYTCQTPEVDTAIDELAFLQSDLTIESTDFEHLLVGQETVFTICTKQLQALLAVVSNPLNKLTAVSVYSNEGSSPILFASELVNLDEIPVLSLKLILATYTPLGPPAPPQPQKRSASGKGSGAKAAELSKEVDAEFGQSPRPAKTRRKRLDAHVEDADDEHEDEDAEAQDAEVASRPRSSNHSSSHGQSGSGSGSRNTSDRGSGRSSAVKKYRRAEGAEEVGNSQGEEDEEDLWLDTSTVKRARMSEGAQSGRSGDAGSSHRAGRGGGGSKEW